LFLLVALAVLLMFALRARALGSVALSNVGSVTLSRALSEKSESIATNELSQAESWFQRALEWDPGNRSAHRGLGWVYDKRGDLQRAGEEWRRGGLTAGEFEACVKYYLLVKAPQKAQFWERRAAAIGQ